MHKSGGATLIAASREALGLERAAAAARLQHATFNYATTACDCDVGAHAAGWDPRLRRCVCPQEFFASVRLLYNGYVPSMAELSEFARPRFVWITAAREPTARLVSAYFFCRSPATAARDPLCGSRIWAQRSTAGPLAAEPRALYVPNATLQQFAAHWGNYLLRELLLFPPLLRAALPSPLPQWDTHAIAWLRLRSALAGGDDPEQPAGEANLRRVEAALRNGSLYDVVTIFERGAKEQASCALLDARLPLRAVSAIDNRPVDPPEASPWCALLRKSHVSHGSEAYKEEEKAALETARQDGAVQRAIAGDVRLWRHSLLPLFDEQVRAAGLAHGLAAR